MLNPGSSVIRIESTSRGRRMKMAMSIGLLVLIVCALLAPPILVQNVTADVKTFRGDLNHTAQFEMSVPKDGTLLWSYNTGDQIQSSPVIFGNKVYVGSNNGHLYAIDTLMGTKVWDVELGNTVMASPTITDDGVIYIGCTNGTFFSIDAATGEVKWSWKVPNPYSQIISSAAVDSARAYFGASDKHIYAINLTTHKEDWNLSVKGDVWGSPALSNGIVYIGSINLDSSMYAISASDGALVWNFSIPGFEGIYSSPTVASGKVIFSSGREDNAVYALNASTGKVDWRFQAPGPGYGSPAINNGTVYIPMWTLFSQPGKLFALPLEDPTPGDGIMANSSIKWTAITGDVQGGSSVIYSKGKLLVGSDYGMGGDGRLFCFDASSGKEIWNLTTGGDVYSSPGVMESVVFVGSLDGRLYAVGGDPSAKMVVKVMPEESSVQGGRIIGVQFLVTYRGLPLEGAFVKVNVTTGELSQNGASTFPDGSQRVKYQAPRVETQTTVTFTAEATFFGIDTAHGSANITVIKASVYKVRSSTTLSLQRYLPYVVLIVALAVVNVTFVIKAKGMDKPRTAPPRASPPTTSPAQEVPKDVK